MASGLPVCPASSVPFSLTPKSDLRGHGLLPASWGVKGQTEQKVYWTSWESPSHGCLVSVLQASTWAEAGQRVLAELEQEHPRVVLQQLQLHWTKHPDLPPSHFRKMWALATGLGSEGIRQECRWAWAQCQDTWLALDQKLEAALKPALPGSTATLCVSRVPAAPATPPLRKSYSFDQNLGQSLREPISHYHHATIVAACHGPGAGGGPHARLFSNTVPPPSTSDFRSPNRYG